MKFAKSASGLLVLAILVVSGCSEFGRDRDWDRDRDRGRPGDSRDRPGRMAEVEGTVTDVDRGHGTFEITRRDRSKVVFFVSRETRPAARERFANLREGDRVRAEGRQREDRHFDLETLR
jgi:tRNA(Ile2) C34 agmatinyltransferase TiaS